MGKDQDFLEAARNGNITLIEKVLSQKAKRSGPLASLRRGPGINVQDNGGYSALHYAALNGHTHIVRLLLVHEASPNILDARGSSPLHLAAWAGHQEIVKMLLTHPYKPANPDMQTMENDTPLHCAAQHGHTGALTTLLAHGANPNVYNSRNETPLDLAAQYGRLQAVQMLIRAHPELLEPYCVQTNYSVNSNPTICTHSALHLASRNGHNNVVEILIAAGVNVNLLTSSGTALHEAALCGKDIVVRTLLEAGCDLNAKDSNGRTALDILREFPPHVTKGIISVINSFSTEYNTEDVIQDQRFHSTQSNGKVMEKQSYNGSNQYPEDNPHESSQNTLQKSNNINVISPCVSMRSFDQSITSSTEIRIANDHFSEFYDKLDSFKIQKPAPKKPPRRNLSISPTHTQNSFINNDLVILTTDLSGDEVTEETEIIHAQNSHGYMGPTKYNGTDEEARELENKSSYESSVFKSYNPNRKLKRNRENYFGRGQFRLTINNEIEQNLPNKSISNSILNADEANESNNHSNTNIQKCFARDDFSQSLSMEPEISPHHRKCQISLCDSMGSISSGVSFSDRSLSTDCVEEYMGDKPFAGSALNLDNENIKSLRYYNIDNDITPGETSQINGKVVNTMSIVDYPSVSPKEALKTTSKIRIYNKDKLIDEGFNNISQNFTSSMKNLGYNSTKSECKTCPFNEKDMEAWMKLLEIMDNIEEQDLSEPKTYTYSNEQNLCNDRTMLINFLEQNGLQYLERLLVSNGYDCLRFMNGVFDERDLTVMNISEADGAKLVKVIKTLPLAKFDHLDIETSLDNWLDSIKLMEYSDNFKKHLYNTFKSVCGVWEVELQTVLEINKIGHRKRILHSVAHVCQPTESLKKPDDFLQNTKPNLRPIKKNRPAPKPPLNIEIRAPSELLIGLPSNLRMKWPHSALSLISNPLKYKVFYLGSTIVKELRGTESTRKSIQRLKRCDPSKVNKLTNDNEYGSLVQLSISYRGVEFIDIGTNGTICEHEIRNINCACQDADDMRHFAYITIDSELDTHYCHVFNVDSMHLAMEIILTLAESFEVAYQMALKQSSTRNRNIVEKLIN